MGNNSYIVIDAGGTYHKSAVVDSNGKVYEGSGYKIKSFSDGTKQDIINSFSQIISHGLAFLNEKGLYLRGLGVACPGPFNFYEGVPLMKHKFKSIYGMNLREELLKVPGVDADVPIGFIHDVNAVLLGESYCGNARGFSNAAVVTLGTGLGFAYTKDGVLQCNELGSPAMHLYNIPYKDSILEDYTAKNGVVNAYRQISKVTDGNIEAYDIGKWADEGDSASIAAYSEVGRILSENLSEILREEGIQCLLFGGQISRSFNHMEDELIRGLKDVQCLEKIAMAKSIDNAALYGAFKAIPQ